MYNRVFDLNLKAPTFLLYAYLLSCTGSKGSCWPSLDTISRKSGLSISTIQEYLKILEQRPLISKSRRRVDGCWGKNNVYTLLSLDNPKVYRTTEAAEELPLRSPCRVRVRFVLRWWGYNTSPSLRKSFG